MKHAGQTLFCLLILLTVQAQEQKEVRTTSGLRYTIVKQGSGEPAKTGQQVFIYESMAYLSGKQFYSIEKPAAPIKIKLGAGQTIAGVDEGVTGMKAGEVRQLIIPPALSKRREYPAYLSKDSTLLYKIELVEIAKE